MGELTKKPKGKVYLLQHKHIGLIGRIKNFIKYKDWNCLKGYIPIFGIKEVVCK